MWLFLVIVEIAVAQGWSMEDENNITLPFLSGETGKWEMGEDFGPLGDGQDIISDFRFPNDISEIR